MAYKKKPVAFEFVWEELEDHFPPNRLIKKPMFGAHGIYVDGKITFILRQRDDKATQRDNGIWVVVNDNSLEVPSSLFQKFPILRPIELFQIRNKKGFSTWLNLPENEEGFEEAALELCQLVKAEDPRIGRYPKPKANPKSSAAKKKKTPLRRPKTKTKKKSKPKKNTKRAKK